MKKLLKTFIITLLFCLLCVNIFASDNVKNGYEYYYTDKDVTVTFEQDTLLDVNYRKAIADSLVYDVLFIQTRSWCWLLGHDYIYDKVNLTTHKAHFYAPRCKLDAYEVTTCSNCNYYNSELFSSVHVYCCPED